MFDPFRSKDTKTEFVFVSVRSPLSNRSPHARDKISPLSFIAERSVGIIMSKLSSIMRLKESAGWIFEARWEGFYDEIGSFSVTDPWQMTIHKPWKSTGTVNIQHFYGTIRYGEWYDGQGSTDKFVVVFITWILCNLQYADSYRITYRFLPFLQLRKKYICVKHTPYNLIGIAKWYEMDISRHKMRTKKQTSANIKDRFNTDLPCNS